VVSQSMGCRGDERKRGQNETAERAVRGRRQLELRVHRRRHPEGQRNCHSMWLLQGGHEGREAGSSSVDVTDSSCIPDTSALQYDRTHFLP
jgi:hypothetical protein